MMRPCLKKKKGGKEKGRDGNKALALRNKVSLGQNKIIIVNSPHPQVSHPMIQSTVDKKYKKNKTKKTLHLY
jgi:hypothetical protein